MPMNTPIDAGDSRKKSQTNEENPREKMAGGGEV